MIHCILFIFNVVSITFVIFPKIKSNYFVTFPKIKFDFFVTFPNNIKLIAVFTFRVYTAVSTIIPKVSAAW